MTSPLAKASHTSDRLANSPLIIPELLRAIFEWLPRGQLTATAQVCALWSAVVLDLIWENVPELRHLISTYSEVTEQWIGDADDDFRTIMTEVLDFRDISLGGRWDVLLSYGRRIRTLAISDETYAPEVVEHLKSRLEGSEGGSSLLPNLRALSFDVDSDGPGLVESLSIIPAGLQTLHVSAKTLDRKSTAHRRLLEHLTTKAPSQLSDMSFIGHGIFFDKVTYGLHSKVVAQCRGTLRTLDVSMFSLTAERLQEIGSIPSLTHLSMIQDRAAEHTDRERLLRAVTRLFPHLHSLGVALIGQETHPWATCISDVMRMLEPCLELRNLRIRCNYWKPLTKEDVRYLGEAWPLMEEFDLDQVDRWTEPNTHFGILQDLARIWSQTLKKLGLPLVSITSIPDPAYVEVKFKKLDTLSVEYCDLEDEQVEAVTDFLTALSPGPLRIKRLCDPHGYIYWNWSRLSNSMETAWKANSDSHA
ncbi:hypothetical protein FRB90_002241 [Tulasnella sp. 427]|nr:hypothetical protein FRB90_002241 [Tulasnella sp. 427]